MHPLWFYYYNSKLNHVIMIHEHTRSSIKESITCQFLVYNFVIPIWNYLYVTFSCAVRHDLCLFRAWGGWGGRVLGFFFARLKFANIHEVPVIPLHCGEKHLVKWNILIKIVNEKPKKIWRQRIKGILLSSQEEANALPGPHQAFHLQSPIYFYLHFFSGKGEIFKEYLYKTIKGKVLGW